MKHFRIHAQKVFRVYMILFFILGMYIAYVQVVKSGEYMGNSDNPRNFEKIEMRGAIYARDGHALALSREGAEPGGRAFPEKNFAEPMLGYLSLKYGKGGLEDKMDSFLKAPALGKNKDFWDYVLRRQEKGQNVYLTIDAKLQQFTAKLLQDKKGSIIVMNPKNGEILALASSPSFDPAQVDISWRQLSANKDSPFLLRPVNGFYPPGSIFKLFTLAVCYEEGVVTPDSSFYCSGDYTMDYELGTYHIRDFGGGVHGSLSTVDALAYSCNISFAQMGLKLGKEKFFEYAEKFGLNEKPDFVLSEIGNSFPTLDQLTPTQLAQTAFGQGELMFTPLSLALMVSAFANDGKIYKPQIIKSRTDPMGKVIFKGEPQVWKTPVSADTARKVREAMIQVVERGTGTAAKMPGLKVAGKSGSAENPMGDTHAWFVCFAPADNPRVLILVMIENGGAGGKVAAPIAAEILKKVFSNLH